MMPPFVEEAIDDIDCSIFSGDTFSDKELRESLLSTIERWKRGLNEMVINEEPDDADNIPSPYSCHNTYPPHFRINCKTDWSTDVVCGNVHKNTDKRCVGCCRLSMKPKES